LEKYRGKDEACVGKMLIAKNQQLLLCVNELEIKRSLTFQNGNQHITCFYIESQG